MTSRHTFCESVEMKCMSNETIMETILAQCTTCAFSILYYKYV